MSPIAFSLQLEQQLTIFTVSGVVSAKQVAEAIESYYSGTVTPLVLWDFREADLSAVSSGGVRQLTAIARQQADRRPGGRTALVFSSTAGYGLGRMYEIQRSSDDPQDVTYSVFRDMARAMEWLRT